MMEVGIMSVIFEQWVRGNVTVKHTVTYWCTQLSIVRYCRKLQLS